MAAGRGGVAAAAGTAAAIAATAVALLGGRGLQEELAGPRGGAGRHVVPAEAPVDLVEVAPDVGFSGEGFEAHGAELSSRAAEGLRTTSNRGRQRGRQRSESVRPQRNDISSQKSSQQTTRRQASVEGQFSTELRMQVDDKVPP